MDNKAALSIADSANNYAFDMHAYLDFPNSPTAYVDLVTPVTDWAIAHGNLLFLSELGVKNGAINGGSALKNLFDYLDANSNIWVGWTTWNLPPYNLYDDSPAGGYTTDGPEMAWYTPCLIPDMVST